MSHLDNLIFTFFGHLIKRRKKIYKNIQIEYNALYKKNLKNPN